ncbi:calcineurin-like phosphoesterase family protein [Acinetobacter baumannii 1288284]|nr:calcineurin-like phosphoesterase family protein [Acinetobacter baumannii 1288284]
MTRLKEIGFDFENDLLVAVGDLVDRGIQNEECISLIDKL